jgi:hypothetical protein
MRLVSAVRPRVVYAGRFHAHYRHSTIAKTLAEINRVGKKYCSPAQEKETEMNLQELTQEYVRKVREFSGQNDSAFRLFVNCNGFETSWETKDPGQLKKDSVSMRNLNGKWIEA